MLVFVPQGPHTLARLAGGDIQHAVAAWAATPGFLTALGLGPGEDEAGEHEAMLRASVEGLARFGARLVAVAEAGFAEGPAAGRGVVADLGWADVTAVFTDEAADLDAVEEAALAVAGRDFEAAWGHPNMAAFLRAHPLSWYDVTEFGGALAAVPTADGIVALQLPA